MGHTPVAVALILFSAVTLAQPSGEKWEIVVLGIAQDGGIPQLGCARPICEDIRAGKRPPEKVSSLGLINRRMGAAYVFDATPDFPAQLQRLTGGKLPAGIFLTHAHIGHYTGLMFLGRESVNAAAVPVYATERLAAFLRTNGPWSQLVAIPNIAVRTLAYDQPVALDGGVAVTAFKVPHRDEFSDTFGFVIRGPKRTVLYVPDTDSWRAWKKPLLDVLAEEKVDLALLDGTFYSRAELPDRDPATIGHPLITDTMDLLVERVRVGALEVRFTHLNHSNLALSEDDAVRKAIAARGFRVLADGDEIEF